MPNILIRCQLALGFLGWQSRSAAFDGFINLEYVVSKLPPYFDVLWHSPDSALPLPCTIWEGADATSIADLDEIEARVDADEAESKAREKSEHTDSEDAVATTVPSTSGASDAEVDSRPFRLTGVERKHLEKLGALGSYLMQVLDAADQREDDDLARRIPAQRVGKRARTKT